MALITLRNISVAFGGTPLLDDIELQVQPGERVGLLGRNGEGKSTLLKIIQGEMMPDRGDVIRQRDLRTALLAQELPAGIAGSVRAVVSEHDVRRFDVAVDDALIMGMPQSVDQTENQ